ncbi:MAG: GPP34 family phosphoprotein [Planctomycetota bacterium]|nr:GPP34 family phosphoprotein [Planctomycetota bacterium]
MANRTLTLQEEVLLVGLNDTTGKVHRGFNWLYPLNAAALAELVLRRRITVNAGQVVVSNSKPVGDDVLDVARRG